MSDDKKQEVSPRVVSFGSAEHMAMLGLTYAHDDDKYQVDGYTLVDLTQFGPMAREEYIMAQLKQRVGEFQSKPSVPQGAPAMWQPTQPPITA